MKLVRTDGPPKGFTTVGYWEWDKPYNQGTLTVYVAKMKDWRHELAVWGHELIEVTYCALRGITTEEADAFDELYERGYADGSIPKENEPGHDPRCPYHLGHMAGVIWEHICIRLTFASWEKYNAECNQIMGI